MTRDKQGELFLLIQTQVAYATSVAADAGRALWGATLAVDSDKAAKLELLLELLGRCEFQRAMDAADAAGFTSAALVNLIETQRQLARRMASVSRTQEGDDTQRIELQSASSSVRARQMPTPEQDAQNARTQWRVSRRKAAQLESALGKIWHYLTSESQPMDVDEIQNELTTIDRALVDEAVDAWKSETA